MGFPTRNGGMLQGNARPMMERPLSIENDQGSGEYGVIHFDSITEVG